MSVNYESKKVKNLNSTADLMHKAGAKIDALALISKELELHYTKQADAMVLGNWKFHYQKYKEAGFTRKDLNALNPNKDKNWQEYVKYMITLAQDEFIRNKINVYDFLAMYTDPKFSMKPVYTGFKS